MADTEKTFTPHGPEWALGARRITHDGLSQLTTTGGGFRVAVVIAGILFLAGLVGFAFKVASVGLGYRPAWGYLAATFAFLLGTVQAVPLYAIALRWAKADWLRPLSRMTHLYAIPGILTVLLYLPLAATLPPIQGRKTLWITWTWGAPALFDGLAVLFAALLSIAILYLTAIPDLAAARDHLDGSRGRLSSLLARRWQGTPAQWAALRWALVLLGALYALVITLVQLLVPYDFAMSLVPGWNSSVFPAHQLTSSFEGAVALTILTLYLWRRVPGVRGYVRDDTFHGSATALFASALLVFYLWWSAFITEWYGRTPAEVAVLALTQFDVYFTPWLLSMLLMVGVPFILLLWRPIRRTILGPTIASVSVLAGIFLDRVRTYTAAYSVADPTSSKLGNLPPPVLPDVMDLLMIAGALGGVVLLYLVGAKLIPPVSMWEVKDDLVLRLQRSYLRGRYVILGKPR